jgi:hypothetical protein
MLNPIKYRQNLKKRLDEYQRTKKDSEVITEGFGKPWGGRLDSLRRRLFDGENVDPNSEPRVKPTDPDLEVVAPDADSGEGILYDEEPEPEIPEVDDETEMGSEQPEEIEPEIGDSPTSGNSEEDLLDLATDTVHEVLLYLKGLRDKFKEQSPQKAQLVRKLYDYILKGKEKIANEMLKDEGYNDDSSMRGMDYRPDPRKGIKGLSR